MADELKGLEMDRAEGGVAGNESRGVGDGTNESIDVGVDSQDASVKKLQEFMVRKGISDIDGLVEYAANLERTNTRMAQDLQRLMVAASGVQQHSGPGAQAKPEDDLERLIPDNPFEVLSDKGKFKEMVANLRSSIWREFEQARQREAMATVQQKLAILQERDPDRFKDLRPIMYEIAVQNPHITDIDEVYRMADEQLKRREQALVERLKQSLGLGSLDPERIRSVANKARISGSGQVDASASKKHKEILDAIANADRY